MIVPFKKNIHSKPILILHKRILFSYSYFIRFSYSYFIEWAGSWNSGINLKIFPYSRTHRVVERPNKKNRSSLGRFSLAFER